MFRQATRIFKLFIFTFLTVSGIYAGGLDPTFAPVVESKPLNLLPINSHTVQADGKIIVSGLFGVIGGKLRNKLARLNANGTTDESFQIGTGLNEAAQIIVVQADGKILLGGAFTTFNGLNRAYLLRLNADGSLDNSFNPILNNVVYEIVVQPDGKILVGGEFTNVNGTDVLRLVRLNADGSLDNSFSVTNSEVSYPVYALAVQTDGKIAVGGDNLDLTDHRPFLRLNADGTTDNSFNIGSGVGGSVRDIALQSDGKYLIGGSFSAFNGMNSPVSIARINADGTLDTSFSSGFSGFPEVHRIKLQTDGKIFIKGNFSFYGTTPVGNFTKLNANGSLDSSFTSGGIDGSLSSALSVLTDGKILVTGNFGFYGGSSHPGIVRVNPNGTPDETFAPRTGNVGTVTDVVDLGGRLVIVGNFSYVNNVPREKIAALLTGVIVDSTFNPGSGVNGTVNSVFRQTDGKILIAGDFISYNGTGRDNVARINSDGTLDTSFNGGAMEQFDSIEKVAQTADEKVLVGGNFGTFNGTTRNFIARLNADGSLDAGFTSPFIGGSVFTLLPQADGKVYVGGSGLNTSQGPFRGFVRLNSDGTIDQTFNIGTGANGTVRSIARQFDGKIIIGGGFTSYNGTNYRGIARINTNGSLDLSFNPGSGVGGTVSELAVDVAGRVFAGGAIVSYDGIAVGNLVRLRNNGSYDQSLPLRKGSNRTVSALFVQSPAQILVGCGSEFDGAARGGLARFANTSRNIPNFDYDGDGRTDLSVFRPSNGQWWLKRSSTGVIAATFGTGNDKPVPADFTGDGKTDVSIFRPSTGEWFILRSEDGTFYSFPFGTNGDIPAVGDFNGDGRYDPTVFRPSTGTWFINTQLFGIIVQNFGSNGDIPVVGDYDGDRISDVAVFRPSNGQWWINQSSTGVITHTFGTVFDKAVPADFTGDGKTDVAFWRPDSGEWFVLRSEDFSFYSFPFGASGDIPTVGDYDGDGKWDAAVFRPSNATWFVNTQTQGTLIEAFGINGDIPTASAFVR